jgi:taurine dioxygenase
METSQGPMHPEILVISNVKENGKAIGTLGDGEAIWHSDMNYMEAPPTGSLLYSLEIPPTGGDTGFCNMYQALETLPKDLRRRIDGLSIKHDSSTNSGGYLRQGSKPVTDVRDCPGAVHPMVCTHPETGRKALFIGRRRYAYIMGLPVDESEKLLDEVWAHATKQAFTWHHQWRLGDVLMWDNRCTMHRRDAFDPATRRVMHRTQIKGSKPS